MKQQKGFTIVELLIVIVVIAILAAIAIVSYSGIQQRARDTERKSDLANLAKVISVYKVDNGSYAEGTCGYIEGTNHTGSGWLTWDYDGNGSNKSINDCLRDAGSLPEEFLDPSGLDHCAPAVSPAIGKCHAYVKISCPAGTWIGATLETKPRTGTELDNTCSGAANWDTQYGFNYVVRVP